MTGPRAPRRPFYGLDSPLPLPTAALCGLQHVLAMFVGIVTPPLIVGGALGLSAAETAFLVSAALFTSGVATAIQVRRPGPLGSGLLSVQGTSFTFVTTSIQTAQAGGLALVFGMTIACAAVEAVLSRFIGLARRLFPPVVMGATVMLIGMSLVGVGMNDLAGGVGAADFGAPRNLGLGLLVMASIVVLNRFGRGLASTLSIAGGILAGYAAAALLGRVDLSAVSAAGWFEAPRLLSYGLAFDPAFLIPWVVCYVVTSIETMGDLTATSNVSREPVEGPVYVRRLEGGVLGDAFNSALAGIFGAMPNTTFSQNNGVIALTGVAARRAGFAAAAILALLGLLPKFAALVAVMPKPVLGGATVVMFSMVSVAGFRIFAQGGLSPRSEFILAVALALGLGVTVAPQAVARVGEVLPAAEIVLRSGIAVGAAAAVALNLVLPEDPPEA